MAVTKREATKSRTATASRTKAAPKKTTTKVATKKTSPTVSSAKTSKSAATAKKTTAPKKAAPAAVKLTDRQLDVLKAVLGTKEGGYLADKKAEAKTLDALASKKLIKKGAKDKASGHVRYHVSKAGEKHVATKSATA